MLTYRLFCHEALMHPPVQLPPPPDEREPWKPKAGFPSIPGVTPPPEGVHSLATKSLWGGLCVAYGSPFPPCLGGNRATGQAFSGSRRSVCFQIVTLTSGG